MTREYISICLRPITRTLPGLQIRDLSFRSTSVHMVSSDSSLVEFSRCSIWAASLVVARARHLPGPPVRLDRTLARQTRGRAPVRLEVVAAPPGALAAVIHDDEVVRQIKDEVALGRGALEPETQRLELQRQIVAKSPVEPEVRIVGAVKKVNEGAKDAEYRGLPASLLLGETAARLLHAARKFAPAKLGSRHRRYLLQRLPDGPEQDLAPLAVRHEAKVPTAGHDRHGRVQKAHVPTGVTSGIL